MDALATFLEMGGYAWFVWPAFAVTIAVLGALLIISLRTLHSQEKALAALRAGSERRREKGDGEA